MATNKTTATAKGRANKRKTGAPSKYSAGIADEICKIIASSSMGLAAICKSNPKFPSRAAFYVWMDSHKELQDKYARAKELQADYMAEEIIAISDDGQNDTYDRDGVEVANNEFIARSRLRVDARKWLAGKLAPKKFGDKVAIGGADDLSPLRSEITLVINGVKPQN